MRPIRLFSCDDDPSFTLLLGFWLEECDAVELVGFGHTREECLARIPELAPEVVLLDSMGHDARRLTVSEVRAAAPGAAVVAYTGYPADAAAKVMVGEPDAFLVKRTDADELVEVVRRLAAARDPRREA
jgi:two-component system, NarL family, response regulator DevR